VEVFGETCTFDKCSNCDNCLYAAKLLQEGGNSKRDFTAEFSIVCGAISIGGTMSKSVKILTSGKCPEEWSQQFKDQAAAPLALINRYKDGLKGVNKFTGDRFKAFLNLAKKEPAKLIWEEKKSMEKDGRVNSYMVNHLTDKGQSLLSSHLASNSTKATIELEIPHFVKEEEEALAVKAAEIVARMTKAGINPGD
tara:strand:+ start:1245 stop:1829 length:585 start_codon:yes stop_codon:yes gene_type:complete